MGRSSMSNLVLPDGCEVEVINNSVVIVSFRFDSVFDIAIPDKIGLAMKIFQSGQLGRMRFKENTFDQFLFPRPSQSSEVLVFCIANGFQKLLLHPDLDFAESRLSHFVAVLR
jgi:hypothetical protein